MSFVVDVCRETHTIGAGGSVLKLGLSQIFTWDEWTDGMVLYKAGLAM